MSKTPAEITASALSQFAEGDDIATVVQYVLEQEREACAQIVDNAVPMDESQAIITGRILGMIKSRSKQQS